MGTLIDKETLTADLYSVCADKIEFFQVNEFGLPITDEQFELYMLKTKEAQKVVDGGTSLSLSLEAEFTNDTVANLAAIILYKQDVYESQLGLIEVIRRVIAEKISVDDLVSAKACLDKFIPATNMLDETIVRSILT